MWCYELGELFSRLYPTHPHEQAAIDVYVADGGQFVDEAGPVDLISDSEVNGDEDGADQVAKVEQALQDELLGAVKRYKASMKGLINTGKAKGKNVKHYHANTAKSKETANYVTEVLACHVEGVNVTTLTWRWLERNPIMVSHFTIFDTWEQFSAFYDWFDSKGLLSRLRVCSSKILKRKKRESGEYISKLQENGDLADGYNAEDPDLLIPSGQSPHRKRKLHAKDGNLKKWNTRDAFFAVNYIIRTGATMDSAARQFGREDATFSDWVFSVTWLWSHFIGNKFTPTSLSKDRVQNRSPPDYQKHFNNRIRRIIDCFPVYIEMPSSRSLRKATYNQYYGISAVKFVTGITPFGSNDQCSQGYAARISDADITDASDALDGMWQGMDLMADKGFLISHILFKRGCGLVQPIEKPRGKRYSKQGMLYSRRVSRKRIHIERGIRRIVEKSGFLRKRVRLSQIWMVDPVVRILAAMSNWTSPVR
jgi:hypothetical protein